MKTILGIDVYINATNIRLWMGSLGFILCLVILFMVVILGYNGEDNHIELTKNFLYVSSALLGLNIIKEGINLNLTNNKTNEDINKSIDDCKKRKKEGTCPDN